MRVINKLVLLLETKGILISRNKFKYYPDFVNLIYKNLILQSSGVLHIGAHVGQEAQSYDEADLKVLWVEGDEEIFPRLQENIKLYSNQRALNVLLGDQDGQIVDFYRSSNDGQSSSLFKFGSESFEDVSTVQIEQFKLRRLDALLSLEDSKDYDHWVVDVQGAELLVLKGAGDLLNSCKWMSIEVSLRETYAGGATFDEICAYLSKYGLFPLWNPPAGFHGDVIFLRLG
jgi:FkbM family methyltransferase